jgi:hypothetical protein
MHKIPTQCRTLTVHGTGFVLSIGAEVVEKFYQRIPVDTANILFLAEFQKHLEIFTGSSNTGGLMLHCLPKTAPTFYMFLEIGDSNKGFYHFLHCAPRKCIV